MKNDTYYLNPIQRDYKSEGGNFNSAKREEHAYTDLFTMTNIRTSLRSGIAENEPGARGGSDTIDTAIDRPRSNRNRSKVIIAVLVVVTMIAVAVAIALAIAVARKDESSDDPGKTRVIHCTK